MNRRIAFGIAAAALTAGFTVGPAGVASAAHCTEDPDRPGQSEYAAHARTEGHPGSEGTWHKGNGSCQERSAVYTG